MGVVVLAMLCLSIEFEGRKVFSAYGGSKVIDVLEEVLDLGLEVLDMIAQTLKFAADHQFRCPSSPGG